MTQAHNLAALIVCALVSSSCADPLPPLRYETEKAVIGTDFDDPLCGYELTAIDEQIEFAEIMLDAPSSEKVEIYLYDYAPEFCGNEAVSGCYNPEQDIIVSKWAPLDHEIVHAVVNRFARPKPFWSEGIAEALRPNRPTIRGFVPIEDNAATTTSRAVERFGAGHFVRWALDRHDMESVKRVLRGESTESALGGTIESLAAQYESEAPQASPGLAPCDFPALAPTAPQRWQETIEVSCDRPDVTRFSERGWTVLRSVELEGGQYEFEVNGTDAWGRLLGCLTEPLHDPIGSMMHGDTMSELEHSLTAPGVRFESGVVHTLELTAGVYELAVPVDHNGQEVEIRLARVSEE